MADPDVDMNEDRDMNPEALQRIVQFLKRNGLKETEEALSREAGSVFGLSTLDAEPSSSLSTDNVTVNDANALSREYDDLIKYVDTSFDSYKPELAALMYPIFANGYLDLIISGQAEAARAFHQRFASVQPSWYSDDVHVLSRISTSSQAASNELVDNLRKHPFMLKMSKSCVKQLEPFLSGHAQIKDIIKEHLLIEAVDCGMRLKDTVEAMSGGVLGEASKQANKQKVYYGTIKEDFSSQLPSFIQEDSKKKRAKSKDAKEGKKKDPNAPAFDRIPLPDWSDSLKSDKRLAQKEMLKKVKISAENPPSVCFFSILNAHGGACCAEITEDTTMMAAGYGNSTVQVFSLNQETLKHIKPMEKLELLDQEAEDIYQQVLDETKGSPSITLKGHSGPVYGTSFSPDKRLLLSCGEDSTIRLWSTQLWSNVVVYRIGGYPIWDVKFSARGYYFATAGADRTAMLWSTDKMQPIRLFTDSFSDVNVNYFIER
uniref:LisH domain-containing protein n=1 Tax=Plectus sambesii TaxID=2011161 RepID=A0A914VIR7_9BILA